MSSFVLNGSAASANYMQPQLPYLPADYYHQQSQSNQLIAPNASMHSDHYAVSGFPYGYPNNHSFHAAQQLNSQLPSTNPHSSLHNASNSTPNSLVHSQTNGQSSTQSSQLTPQQQLSINSINSINNINLQSTTTTSASIAQNHLSTILPPASSSYPYSQHQRYLIGGNRTNLESAQGSNSAATNTPPNQQPNYPHNVLHSTANSDLLTTVNSAAAAAAAATNAASSNFNANVNSTITHSTTNLNGSVDSSSTGANNLTNSLPNGYYSPFSTTEFNRHLSSYNNSPLLGNSSTNSSPGFPARTNAHLNHLANQHLNNLNNLTNHNGTYSSPLAALSNAVNNCSFVPASAPFHCKLENTPDSPPESTSSNSLHSINGQTTQNGTHLTSSLNSLTNGNSIHHDYTRQTNLNSTTQLHHPSMPNTAQLTSSANGSLINGSCSMMSTDNNSSQNMSSSNTKSFIYPWMKKMQVNAGKSVFFRIKIF